jgi:tryptophanyl-tRNA synthetase
MSRMPATSTRSALPRILSGMQPTSDSLHLGNHIGALVNWVKLQDEEFDTYYFVANLHALTVPTDPEVLLRRTRLTAAQFIAGGVDPARSTLFLQSDVAEHAELGWVCNCLTSFGEANRMTQF